MGDVKIILVPLIGQGPFDTEIAPADLALVRRYVAKLTEYFYTLKSTAILPGPGGRPHLHLVFQEGATDESRKTTDSNPGFKIFYRR